MNNKDLDQIKEAFAHPDFEQRIVDLIVKNEARNRVKSFIEIKKQLDAIKREEEAEEAKKRYERSIRFKITKFFAQLSSGDRT